MKKQFAVALLAFTTLIVISCARAIPVSSSSGDSQQTAVSSSSQTLVSNDAQSSASLGSSGSAVSVIYENSTIKLLAKIDSSILNANYATSLPGAQILTDLQLIAKYMDFKPIDNLTKGQSASSTDVKPLAKRTQVATLSAGTSCTALSRDTSYTVQGTTYVDNLEYLSLDGTPKVVCADNDSSMFTEMLLAMFSDAKLEMYSSEASSFGTMYATMFTSLSFTSSTSSTVSTGNLNYTLQSPHTFHMYFEFQQTSVQAASSVATQASASTSDPAVTGNATFWFQNGSYKCAVPMADMHDSIPGYNCDITQNGIKVGILTNNGSDKAVVTDPNGNVVQ